MGTYERDAVIAKLIDRAREQLGMGVAHAQRGDVVAAESWLRPALATLDALQAHLDGTPPARKLAVVGNTKEDDSDLQPWIAQKFGGPDDDAA